MLAEADLEGLLLAALESKEDERSHGDAILYVQLKVFSGLSDAKGGRRFGVSLRGCP